MPPPQCVFVFDQFVWCVRVWLRSCLRGLCAPCFPVSGFLLWVYFCVAAARGLRVVFFLPLPQLWGVIYPAVCRPVKRPAAYTCACCALFKPNFPSTAPSLFSADSSQPSLKQVWFSSSPSHQHSSFTPSHDPTPPHSPAPLSGPPPTAGAAAPTGERPDLHPPLPPRRLDRSNALRALPAGLGRSRPLRAPTRRAGHFCERLGPHLIRGARPVIDGQHSGGRRAVVPPATQQLVAVTRA